MQITPILKKLENIFTRQQSIAFKQLQNGLSRTEIEEKATAVSLTFPPEVIELFEWRNGKKDSGVEKIGNLLLFPWGIMEPLDSLVSVHQASTNKQYFPKTHFPIFTSGGGDFILINCDQEDDFYGYLYWHSLALYGTELYLRFDSLNAFLQCMLECFEAGAYYFEAGALERKDDLADTILARYEIPEEE